MKPASKAPLARLARPGQCFAVRVTPRAGRNALTLDDDNGERDAEAAPPRLRARVTAAPEEGKANRAVIALLADTLGVAKSRLTLLRGATARDKLIRLD